MTYKRIIENHTFKTVWSLFLSLRRTGQLKKFNLNELAVFGMIKEKNTEVLDMKKSKLIFTLMLTAALLSMTA